MKFTKKGKLKLGKNETFVGRFVFSAEPGFIKVRNGATGTSATFSLRVSTGLPLGAWLSNILRMGDGGRDTLNTWATTMLGVLSPVPEDEFVRALLKASDEALRRRPELYFKKKEGQGGQNVSDESGTEKTLPDSSGRAT